MDPAAITTIVVREVARDGTYGAHAHDVWRFASQAAKQPLDNTLKDVVWLWLAQHPAIHIKHDRAYASEDLQWLELTGNPKQGSIVPQLAFNVLCAVAHSREAGISTVDVAKQVGQDPRSLFGRVQLLVDLGLVQRFPVIEKGSSTHRIVLMPYVSHHLQGQSATNSFIDKRVARKQITDFCKSGPQGLRLKRDVVAQVGKELTTNTQRRRPLVISLLKDLESRGFVRSIQVFDPATPSKAYACVQFVNDYDVGTAEKRTNSAWTDTVLDFGEGVEADETGPDEIEFQAEAVADLAADSLDLSRAVTGEVVLDNESVQANISMPLVNQIHDLVVAAGGNGVSAMDLTRKLTGKSYSKALGKYLDALTGGTKSKTQSLVQPTELGHLSLIKGVDFAHRVKYYRYFTRMTYPDGAIDEKWGSFSSSSAIRDSKLSLKILDAQSRLPLPGGCTIIETEDGNIRPVFHGGKATAGKIVLVSDPSRTPGVVTAAPAKRRGRPPKNAPRPPPETPKPSQNKPSVPPPLESVRIGDRQWEGGSDSERKASKAIWLHQTKALQPCQHTKDGKSEKDIQFNSSSMMNNEFSDSLDAKSPSEMKQTTPTSASVMTEKSLGSLAFTRRLETLRGVVRDNKGAVVGGQDLVDRFNAAAKSDSIVDRKTIDRVTKTLVKQGVLRQIFVNIPTMTGIHLMKYILYDPEMVGNTDESPLIAELKHELNDRTRVKQSIAAKAAAGNNRLNEDHTIRQEMTADQARAFRPLLGQRLATTATRRKPVSTQRFGASAAEVANGVSSGGSAKRTKQSKRSRPVVAPLSEDIQVPLHYGSIAITPKSQSNSREPATRSQSAPAIDSDWLFRAAVVSRSLFPRGKNVDWTLVAQSAPAGTSEKRLKQQWHVLQNDYPGGATEIMKRCHEWEDMFAEAYAADEIVYLKPSDRGFTLQHYIDWWRVADQSLSVTRSQSQMHKAASKNRLRNLKLRSQGLDSKLLDPLSSLQSQPSMIRSEELLVKTLLGVPLETEPLKWKQVLKLSDNAAKLRAVIAADSELFSAKDAIRELENVSEEDAKQALTELERNKYIQWAVSDPEKIPVGRPYVLSEKVMNMLVPPAKLERDLPNKAMLAVSEMSNNEIVDVPETIDESQMIPLLEMATFGLDGKQVELQRSGEHSGRLSNHYRSRDIDKGEFNCDIRAKISEMGSKSDARAQNIAAPESSNVDHPCIWQTSHLTSHNIWSLVKYKLLATVLFRPGIGCDALAQSLRHVLEKEEVYKAVNALIQGEALSFESGGLKSNPNWFAYIS